MKSKAFLFSTFVALAIMFSCNNSTTDTDQNNKELNHDSIVDITKDQVKDQTKGTDLVNTEKLDNKTLSLSTEKIIFSFETDKGKTMSLSMDKNNKYLVYRFGQSGKVELQYPTELTNTFDKFTYNYYMRGGGPGNAGLDLNYVSFTGDTHKVIIFDEYSAGDPDNPKESETVGIRLVDLKTGKEIKIRGLIKTKKGTLVDFRDNGLIQVKDGEI